MVRDALELRGAAAYHRKESGRPRTCRDGRDGVGTTFVFSVEHGNISAMLSSA